MMTGSVGAKHVLCSGAVTCPARSPVWPDGGSDLLDHNVHLLRGHLFV